MYLLSETSIFMQFYWLLQNFLQLDLKFFWIVICRLYWFLLLNFNILIFCLLWKHDKKHFLTKPITRWRHAPQNSFFSKSFFSVWYFLIWLFHHRLGIKWQATSSMAIWAFEQFLEAIGCYLWAQFTHFMVWLLSPLIHLFQVEDRSLLLHSWN